MNPAGADRSGGREPSTGQDGAGGRRQRIYPVNPETTPVSTAAIPSAQPIRSEPAPDLAWRERQLEYWEVLFRIRPSTTEGKMERIGNLSTALRRFCVEELDEMAAEYKTAGLLSPAVKNRIGTLRDRIAGGPKLMNPGSGFAAPVEPFYGPIHR